MRCWECVCGLICLAGIVVSYEVGTEYKYAYKTTVDVRERCDASDASQAVGHRIKAQILLTSLWVNPQNPKQNVIKIQISNPQFLVPKKSVLTNHKSEFPNLSEPSYLLYDDGSAKRVFENSKEDALLRNLKKGIASLLHVRKTPGQLKETDVSGTCDVAYEVRGKSIRKLKRNCVAAGFDPTLSQLPGIRSLASHHESISDYDLLEDDSLVVASCKAKDVLRMHSNTWRRPSLCVDAKSELIFEGIRKPDIFEAFKSKDVESLRKEIMTSIAGKAEESVLEAIIPEQEKKKEKTLHESLSKLKDSLKSNNLASLKSATAFFKLLPISRVSSEEEILKILSNKKFKDIKPQVLDLLAASLTEESVKAVFKHFQKVTDYDESLERYLVSLSVTPRQFPFMLKEIKSFTESAVRDEKIHATLLSTLGALLKSYANNELIAEKEIIDNYRIYLESLLKKCQTDSCKITSLHSLKNAGLPGSVPLLLQYVSEGGKVALEAVAAIGNVPSELLPSETEFELLKTFYQLEKKHDRSTRSIAAEIILKKSTNPHVLRAFLQSLRDQVDPEFSTHLASKILHMASKDEIFRARLQKLLLEKDVGQYYSLSQKGASAILSKYLLSSEDVNVTYSLEMEMLSGGLLKRSIFDVAFENDLGPSNFLTVGIFAEGLGSLAGAGDEWEEGGPTAGMELTVLGSHLRPYVFFSSTSELMGHAWSGTASEPTPALQGIFAFSDDEQIHILSNGMPVRVQLRAILSVDSSGSIQVSLWSRTSTSLVKNAGALFVRGSVSVDLGFARTQGALQFSGQTSIDFKTETEFAETPFRICIKMEHPPVTVKHDVFRSVTVDGGSKFHLKKTKKRKRQVEGNSYPLHKRNSELCTLMNS